MFSNYANTNDIDGSERREGVLETGLPFGKLEPEIVDVFGSGLDSPRGERIGGQSRLKPIGKGLRGGEIGIGEGHGGDSEKSTVFRRERGEEGEGLESFGGGEEKEKRERSEKNVREGWDLAYAGFFVAVEG